MIQGKRLYKTIFMLTITSTLFFITLFLFLSITFGWFASNQEASATGMAVVLSNDNYDVYVEKTEKYDQIKNGEEVYEGIGIFKQALIDLGKSFNTTNNLYTSNLLALELDNEVKHDNVYHLVPGSFGSFTLYIKPNVEDDFVVTLDIELSGYKKGYDNNDNLTVFVPNESDEKYLKALDMLKGHIMFFDGRTKSGNVVTKYTNFFEHTITYNTSGKSKTTIDGVEYYKLVVYWEWPLLYSDIIDNIRSSEDMTKKYPSAVGTYIANHPEYYLASNIDGTDIDDLSDGYNDGDQLIGDNIHFLVVTLK